MLYDNVMVPYDGSPSATAALAEAVRFAKEDPGLTLHIVQIMDTEKLVIEKLEASGPVNGAVPDGMREALEEVTAEANRRLHGQVDGMLAGLMNKVVVELLRRRTPAPRLSPTRPITIATSSSWARAGWARCAASWAA